MPNPTETAPDTGFDPVLFWQLHKTKIIIYAVLILAGLAVFAAYQLTTEKTKADARRAFADAKSGEKYREVAKKYPGTVAAGNAQLLLAEQLRKDRKYDDAIATLRDFIKASPQHPLASSAWLSLGETLEAAGNTDEALDTYQQTASKFPESYAAPIAAMARADLLKGKGKPEEAKQSYENIVSQFPESMFANEAKERLRLLPK
jgi:TolA-binding protein